jgi:hypothetical protein
MLDALIDRPMLCNFFSPRSKREHEAEHVRIK